MSPARITLRPAELARDRAALRQLNREYMSWVMGQLQQHLAAGRGAQLTLVDHVGRAGGGLHVEEDRAGGSPIAIGVAALLDLARVSRSARPG